MAGRNCSRGFVVVVPTPQNDGCPPAVPSRGPRHLAVFGLVHDRRHFSQFDVTAGKLHALAAHEGIPSRVPGLLRFTGRPCRGTMATRESLAVARGVRSAGYGYAHSGAPILPVQSGSGIARRCSLEKQLDGRLFLDPAEYTAKRDLRA